MTDTVSALGAVGLGCGSAELCVSCAQGPEFHPQYFNKGKGRRKVACAIHKVILLESPKFSDLMMQRCVAVATVTEN